MNQRHLLTIGMLALIQSACSGGDGDGSTPSLTPTSANASITGSVSGSGPLLKSATL